MNANEAYEGYDEGGYDDGGYDNNFQAPPPQQQQKYQPQPPAQQQRGPPPTQQRQQVPAGRGGGGGGGAGFNPVENQKVGGAKNPNALYNTGLLDQIIKFYFLA